jgi:hypothetical protein
VPPSTRPELDHPPLPGQAPPVQRLYVAWQDPDSRAIRPVGVLTAHATGDGLEYEFRYVKGALGRPFRPFVSFPELHDVYRSPELFPMFENRLMAPGRDDYQEYLDGLGLLVGAAPFEVLAASFGRRATDRVEVFAEPTIDPATGAATCQFLARGIRHIPGAASAVDRLSPGDQLHIEPEPGNDFDSRALRLIAPDGATIGYVPGYLLAFLHRATSTTGGFDNVEILVEQANRGGHVHLRLLCRLRCPMPPGGFSDPDLEPIVTDGVA